MQSHVSDLQDALTLYRDAIHRPGDGGLGFATGNASQHTVFSWSEDEVPRRANEPIRSS